MKYRQWKRRISLVMSLLLVWTLVPGAALSKSKKAKHGAFVVSSTSYGAEIRLDGEMIARVPFEEPIELAPGTYQLELYLRGYMRHTENVTITAGTTQELEVDLIAVEGVVQIDTGQVIDVVIEVDGEIIGSTPFDGVVPAGAHTVRLYKTGYTDILREIRIQAGKSYALDYDMEPIPVAPAAAPVGVAATGSDNPFYETWWFWTVTGVAVAGAVTGVAIGAEPASTPAPFDHVISLPPVGSSR